MKVLVWLMKKAEILTSASCRLAQLTGGHPSPVHPKHLVSQSPWFSTLLRNSDRVLEIGCDKGMMTFKIAPFVHSVIGFDASEDAITSAKKEMYQRKIHNVSFSNHDAEKKFPWKDKSFDTILLLDVIEHVQKRISLLQECHRALKDHGFLFLSAPNRDTSWKRMQRRVGLSSLSDPHHFVEYTKGELRAEILKAKFTIEKIDVIVYDTPLAPLIDVVGGISLRLYERFGQWKRKMVERYPEDTVGWRIVCRKVSG